LTERRRSLWVVRRFVRRPAAVGALLVLAALIAVAIFDRQVSPYDWEAIDLRPEALNRGPTPWATHLFGTDHIGRDILSRTIYGLHTTVEIGLAVAGIALLIGVPLGILSGYYGGWLDSMLMRVVDLVTAFPAVMLSLAAIVFFRPVWPHTLMLVLGLYMWTVVARVVRAHAAAVRATEYVEAATALGASDVRILRSHLLPNIAGTILVAGTSVLGQAILLDATIEFFNYGLPVSRWPSLGNLLADVTFTGGLGLNGYRQLGWWTWTFPALALTLLLICVNLVGDELDAALNPARSRQARG
jgi:peptide/nickel transport system permease protein